MNNNPVKIAVKLDIRFILSQWIPQTPPNICFMLLLPRWVWTRKMKLVLIKLSFQVCKHSPMYIWGLNLKRWSERRLNLRGVNVLGGQVHFSLYTLSLLPYCSYISSWVIFFYFSNKRLLKFCSFLIALSLWPGLCGTLCRQFSDSLQQWFTDYLVI